jgi:hypothetical protein
LTEKVIEIIIVIIVVGYGDMSGRVIPLTPLAVWVVVLLLILPL